MGFPELCEPFQQINQTRGKGPWEPLACRQLARAQVMTWARFWHLQWVVCVLLSSCLRDLVLLLGRKCQDCGESPDALPLPRVGAFLPPASGGCWPPWLVVPSLQSLPPSPHLLWCPVSSAIMIMTLVPGCRAHRAMQDELISRPITARARPFCKCADSHRSWRVDASCGVGGHHLAPSVMGHLKHLEQCLAPVMLQEYQLLL